MLKVFAVVLFALHCNCQNVIEVRGDKVIRAEGTHLPLKTVTGLSGLSGISGLPVNSYVQSLPALSYGLNINGVNLGYLNGLRDVSGSSVYGSNLYGLNRNLYGSAINIAPSPLSIGLVNNRQSLLAIRQPHVAISHPTVQTLGIAQPTLAVAKPVVQTLAVAKPAVHIAQPALAIARPQVLTQAVQTEAVRPVAAAIHQVGRTVEYRNVPHHEAPAAVQDIVVEPSDQPINIHFRSRSSTVRLSQEHIPGEPGTIEQTQSQDEPSKVIHEVSKPVIQEVREVIQPYRQVTQEINPVVENVHRVVSQGEAVREQYVQEPVRQVVQAVRQVQPVSYAVAQPAISVAQPAIAVARPAIAVAQRAYAVQQPLAIAQRAIAVQQPIEYQTVSVQEPIVSSIIRQPVIQRLAQPYIGYNRIAVSEQLPAINIQQDVRELRQPELRQEVRQVVRQEKQNSNDFINYAESDD